MKRIVDFAKLFMEDYLHQASVCVDFTMGNGNDTLWLAKKCPQGHITAFDIQQEAIEMTHKKINTINAKNVHLILDNHENFDRYIQSFDVGIFNLGYLPGGKVRVPTQLSSTKIAIEKALCKLTYKGLLMIVVYPGHDKGKEESHYLKKWSENLNQEEFICFEFMIKNVENSPYIIGIEKRVK